MISGEEGWIFFGVIVALGVQILYDTIGDALNSALKDCVHKVFWKIILRIIICSAIILLLIIILLG
jgi:hypothetical protein